MKIDICIRNKKEGYASLEVIAMSLIGFTLVLALLSIALNKRVLIQSEIKAYEKRLNEDDDRNEFLEERLSLINNKKKDNIESIFNILEEDKKTQVLDTDENLGGLGDKGVISDGDKERLKVLKAEDENFRLYLNKEEDIFILEENLGEDDIKTYYYKYEFIEDNLYLKERTNFHDK